MGQAVQEIMPAAPADRPVAEQRLITLDPVQFVTAVYQPYRTRLAEAIAAVKDVQYDVTTPAGIRLAAECRRRFKEIRVEAERERQARKAPVLEIGRLLDSRAREFEKEIAPYEERFDRDIKKQEAEVERKRQEEIATERARTDAIQGRIAAIIRQPLLAVGRSSKDIATLHEALKALAHFDFQEFKAAADTEFIKAARALTGAYSAALAQEVAAENLRKDQAALIERQAELERVSREQREAEDARIAESQRKLDERDAELKRQEDELAQQKLALKPAAEPLSPALVEADDAPPVETILQARDKMDAAPIPAGTRPWRPDTHQILVAVASAFGMTLIEARECLIETDFGAGL